ncbi:pilus assembly protein TadG-related protein [Paracoccus salsus]|uniref:pilus assembly protein TadG-related protein n=1 Tax=Paracoccus salsus TaxID=2911061 RepID=UPI001F316ABA|nr:pilus assembly protein TadG-related protein [Paracoccus salsus]MCF3972576.1 pilus assembly protein TadG-related protein [Paracoccus salsus]
MTSGRVRRILDLLPIIEDQRGATAVIVALCLPLIAGGMGFGAEAGFHFLLQRNMQQAADMAAHAGAVRVRAGDAADAVTAAARRAAVQSGFDASDETFFAFTPPVSGAFQGSTSSVEVQLRLAQPRFFSAIFTDEPVRISARAVANVRRSTTRACVLALAPTAPQAVTVTGSTTVEIENCDVVTNSNASDAFYMQNKAAKLTVGCVRSVGGAVTGAGLTMRNCAQAEELAPVVRDPYADVVEPAIEGTCLSQKGKKTTSFAPNFIHSSGVPALRICGGLDIKSHASFAPGLYIIDGGELSLNANGDVALDEASMSGEGVTFYLAGDAALSLSGNGKFSMRAPSSGPYAGILFFGSRTQTGLTHKVLGNSGSTTQGAIYFPSSDVRFTGNSNTSNGCTQIIGYTVEFTGNSTLRSSCLEDNIREIETSVVVALVE